MDLLSKKAQLSGREFVYYKFINDPLDQWELSDNPPWKLERTMKFRLPEDITRLETFYDIRNELMGRFGRTSREATIVAVQTTEETIQNLWRMNNEVRKLSKETVDQMNGSKSARAMRLDRGMNPQHIGARRIELTSSRVMKGIK